MKIKSTGKKLTILVEKKKKNNEINLEKNLKYFDPRWAFYFAIKIFFVLVIFD